MVQNLILDILNFISECLSLLKKVNILESYTFEYETGNITQERSKNVLFDSSLNKMLENLEVILKGNSKIQFGTTKEEPNNICNNFVDINKANRNLGNNDGNTTKEGPCKLHLNHGVIITEDLTSINMDSKISHVGNVIHKNGKFICSICDKEFSNKCGAVRHSRTHTGDRPYSCGQCFKHFASKTSMESHLLRVHNHNTETALACAECGKLFVRKNSLDVHLLTHTKEKPFACTKCGKTFSQKITLLNHSALHTNKYDYNCYICKKKFASQAKLNAHHLTHEAPRFTCEVCDKKFVRRYSLMLHLATHSTSRPYKCSSCTKSFRSEAKLLLHEQMHKNDSKFKCGECGSTFCYEENLNIHIKKKHIDKIQAIKDNECHNNTFTLKEGNHKCNLCQISFNDVYTFNDHKCLPTTSLDELFSCDWCSRKFSQKSKLLVHMKTHTQSLQFRCKFCEKEFYRKDLLKNHEFLHTGQRPHICPHCTRGFASKSNLKAHMTIHQINSTPEYQCLDCDKKFKYKNSLTAHRKVHVAQFDFQCQECGKRFLKKNYLESHVRSHSDDRPHACPSCPKRYKERKHRQEHIRKYHSDPTFNFETLFTSITYDDVKTAEMLCGNDESLKLENEQINTFVAMDTSTNLSSAETFYKY